MDRVQIDVSVASVRIAFSGSQPFYERKIEPLIESVYRHAATQALGSTPSAEAVSARVTPSDLAQGAGEASSAIPASPASEPVPSTPRAEATNVPAEVSRPSSPTVPQMPDVFRPASPASFQQFTAKVGDRASTPQLRVLAFAFYMWNYEKRESFTQSELEGFLRLIHEPEPDNLAGRLKELADDKGFLERRGDDGWTLRSKGVNLVKMRLLGQI